MPNIRTSKTEELSREAGEARIRKALESSDFVAQGGLHNADRTNEFEKMLRGTNDMMQIAPIEFLKTLRKEYDKEYIGRRFLEPGTEATTFTDVKQPDFGNGTVTLAKFTGADTVSYESLVENIEGPGYLAGLNQRNMQKAANDLSDVIVNGDTASGTPFYAKFDGFAKLAENGYVIDAEGATISRNIFYQGYRNLPKEVRRKKSMLKWFSNTLLQTDWREVYGNRATLQGDASTIGQTFSPDGIPIITCDEIEDSASVGYTSALYGEHIGTVLDAFVLTTGTNTAITVNQTIDGAASGNTALVATAGTYTAPELARHLNVLAVAGGLTACFAARDGKLVARTTKTGATQSIEIVAVANSMYTTVGFTAATYSGAAASATGTINRGTYALLTMPDNLVIYIHDTFRSHVEYIARSDEYEFTTHIHANVRIIDPTAIAKVKNIRLLDYV